MFVGCWLVIVGWDYCSLNRGGEVVFFYGCYVILLEWRGMLFGWVNGSLCDLLFQLLFCWLLLFYHTYRSSRRFSF